MEEALAGRRPTRYDRSDESPVSDRLQPLSAFFKKPSGVCPDSPTSFVVLLADGFRPAAKHLLSYFYETVSTLVFSQNEI